ncbi:hypothetical protein PSTG_02907 [Puccinia striiformis f. sp. tritici PST-78]|uniref:Uncharacterized protein n=1 Tax=Puccinia striiformis f. sp. tritici PST-78 TaxID=1165861 RepID=A0A0L0VX22_9BASI|nr:hypothetical protein PSTG_02907 [Puccinia striiformis f. sp. tritici PST-78]
MSYVHCQHTSADTAPCRCPVWEAPEGDAEQAVKSCDTCGHRAEWHYPQMEPTESEAEIDRCKSSWPNGQPCTCPTWVAPEDATQGTGCALCGHKKGWHRPTITRASSTQATPAKTKTTPSPAELFKAQETNWHSRAQSCGTGNPDDGLKVRTCTSSSWTPGTKPSSPDNRGTSDSPMNGSNSFFTPDSSAASPSSVWSSTNPLPTVNSQPIHAQLAAEHIRFILSELDDDEDEPSEPDTNFPNNPRSPPNFSRTDSDSLSMQNRDRSLSRSSQSSFSLEAPMANLQWTRDGRSPSPSFNPFFTQSINSNSSFASQRMPRASVDTNSCSGSISFSSVSEGFRAPLPRTQSTDYKMRINELDLNGVNPTPVNSQLRPPAITPLMAQTISETYVEELPTDRPKHPSEERSGRFAAKPTDVASNFPLNDPEGGTPLGKAKPFQSNVRDVIVEEIAVLGEHTETIETLNPVSLQETPTYNPHKSKKETIGSYQTKDHAISLSISPSPSTTTFSPGDYINVTIQLKNSVTDQEIFSPIEFEQQLAKWKKITFQLTGTVTQNGTVEHEIFNLSQVVHLSEQRGPSGNKTGWQFKLRIPTHTNCDCGPGRLPLPSSCSNSVGHVSYHLVLQGRRKTFLGKASIAADSKLFVGLKLRSNLTDPRQRLLTFPQSVRSLSSWIGLNGGQKAAITDTLLTYQVEFLSNNSLKILYELDLHLSADSELSSHNLQLFEELSSNLKVTITSLNELIQSHISTGAGHGGAGREDLGMDHKSRDYRSRAMPTRSDTTGLITWKTTGYLQVDLFGPDQSSSSNETSPKKCLMDQLRLYTAKAQVVPCAKDINSQWILRASIQSVLLSQPINIRGTLIELQSTCAARSIVQGIPLTLR